MICEKVDEAAGEFLEKIRVFVRDLKVLVVVVAAAASVAHINAVAISNGNLINGEVLRILLAN